METSQTTEETETAHALTSFQSGSKSVSSTTLRDDEDTNHSNAATRLEHNEATKVSVPQRRKHKGTYIVTDRQRELPYQKVLRAARMTSQPIEGEPVFQLHNTGTAKSNALRIRKFQEVEPGNLTLASWQRALGFVGMGNFAARSDSNKVERRPVFNLNDDGIAGILEILMDKFGRGTNSSFLDDSYSIYLLEGEQAAVCFKVSKNVAVMYGDALCAADQMGHTFETFHKFCRQQRWHVAVVGAGPMMAAYVKEQSWRSMEFAVEQVLNPVTNGILDETSGKTINRVNRRLVSSGIKLSIYEPSKGIRPRLQQDLTEVYNAWREDRRQRNAPQAYSAVINPFALPGVSRYMYTTGSCGRPNSLAGLIRLGSNNGYLLEPCIASPGAPKGVTDFLVTHAMGLLRDENVTYLTFGLEALPELGEITRMPSLITVNSRQIYRITFDALGLGGRKIFHEKFHPDEEQRVPLYLLFPPGFRHLNVIKAVLNVTNISAHEVWSRSQVAHSDRRRRNRIAKRKQLATNNGPQQHEGNDKREP
jgi:hypothetical protein